MLFSVVNTNACNMCNRNIPPQNITIEKKLGKKLFKYFIYISLCHKKFNSTNHIAINSKIISSQKKVFFFQVNCDNCNKWLHKCCLGFTDNEYEQIKTKKYYCIYCTYLTECLSE